MDRIKSNLIGTIIMEVTRRQAAKRKNRIRAFCDKILFNEVYRHGSGDFKSRKDTIIRDLKAHHHTNINLNKIASVRDLEKRINDTDGKLIEMYDHSAAKIDWNKAETPEVLASHQRAFINFYQYMIEKAISQSGLQNLEDDGDPKNNFDHLGIDGAEKSGDELGLSRGLGSPKSGGVGMVTNLDSQTAQSFFLRLTSSIFKNINFYNLLHVKITEASNLREGIAQLTEDGQLTK